MVCFTEAVIWDMYRSRSFGQASDPMELQLAFSSGVQYFREVFNEKDEETESGVLERV